MDADLSMAAHYYTIAVDKHVSARANFNLGYMHEWGIGLKQDFPLASSTSFILPRLLKTVVLGFSWRLPNLIP